MPRYSVGVPSASVLPGFAGRKPEVRLCLSIDPEPEFRYEFEHLLMSRYQDERGLGRLEVDANGITVIVDVDPDADEDDVGSAIQGPLYLLVEVLPEVLAELERQEATRSVMAKRALQTAPRIVEGLPLERRSVGPRTTGDRAR